MNTFILNGKFLDYGNEDDQNFFVSNDSLLVPFCYDGKIDDPKSLD